MSGGRFTAISCEIYMYTSVHRRENLRCFCSLALPHCQKPLREDKEGERGGEEEEGDEHKTEEYSNPAQLALLEVWMGLPGYGTTRGGAAGGEAAAAASAKLRKALNFHENPAASSSEGGSAEEGVEAIAPAPTLEVRRQTGGFASSSLEGCELNRVVCAKNCAPAVVGG